MAYDRHRLPNAPDQYDRDDQDRVRSQIEDLITAATRQIGGMSTSRGQLNLSQNELKLVNGANHNVPMVKTTHIRIIGPDAAFSISGLAGGEEGSFIILRNTTSQQVTIFNESANSYPENRIRTPRNADLVLSAANGQSLILIYDTGIKRWVVVDQGDYVLRSGDTMTGRLNVDQFTWTRAINVSGTDLNALMTSGFYDGQSLTNSPDGTSSWFFVEVFRYSAADTHIRQEASSLSASGGRWVRWRVAGTWLAWQKLWNAANDGAGSGLDADLLDGQDSSYYTNIPARLGYTPVNKAGDSMAGNLIVQGDILAYRAGGGTGIIFFNSAADRYLYWDGSNYIFGAAGTAIHTGNLGAQFTTNWGGIGYVRLPNGIIIQWGVDSSGAASARTITFPTAFPNRCFGVAAVGAAASGSARVVAYDSISRLNFVARVKNLSDALTTNAFAWMAIGF